MKAAIEEQTGGHPEEAIRLVVTTRAGRVAGLEACVQLQHLTLAGIGLNTLENFPALSNLKLLDVTDNRLSGGLENLSGCTSLETIRLTGNSISSLDDLLPLQRLMNLKNLSLARCEVANAPNYRTEVFAMIPTLKSLDGCDANNKEVAQPETEIQEAGAGGAGDDEYDEYSEPGLAELVGEGDLEDDEGDYVQGADEEDIEDSDIDAAEDESPAKRARDEEGDAAAEVSTEEPAKRKRRE